MLGCFLLYDYRDRLQGTDSVESMPGVHKSLKIRALAVSRSINAKIYHREKAVVAHAGVLCTFRNRSAPGRGKWCDPSGQSAWLSIAYKIKPCWVTLIQPARQAAGLRRPSSLRPHWLLSTSLPSPCFTQKTHIACDQMHFFTSVA